MSDYLNEARAKQQKLETVTGWLDEFRERMALLTAELIAKDNEQTRGAIKELRRLIELPQDRQAEVERESAALPDQSGAAS